MKLTKKLESEILHVYKTWWKSYLSGDVKTYNRYLDKDYRFVGSTEAEAFLNKRDTTGFFEETADQLAGKSALRNSVLKTEQFDGLVFITELADVYLLYNKKWTFYGKFRFSSVLKKNREGWRFIYQHFSVPDSKVNEGETIGLEKITTENQELRDAIKRRTIELENKNQELKIESSLERVRAVAMGMKTREDMLRICETIARELGKLGVRDIRNVQTAIFYPERGTYMNYEYYARHKKTFVTETSYGNNRIHHAFARRMLRGKGELYKAHIRGEKKLKEWIAYQKTTNVFIDPHLRKANSLNYYWFSLGPVALGISTYNPLTNEHLVLFQRFLKVFELSYRRYLDIEKAEAQAREAQVQLALERVRARAMAMQRSGELSDLVDTVFRELTRLDFALKWCIINIIDEPNLTNTVWAANPDMSKAPESYLMKFEDYPFHHAMLKGYRDRKTNAVYILEGNEKKAYDKYLFSATEFRRVPAAAQAASRAMKRYVVNFTFSNFGGLQVVGETPLSESGIDILARFGKVFDLTYTRFNDLLKAEEQARQAEIELALERVRAKTMAMQHSDALPEAANLLFNQVHALGLPAWSAGYCIWSEDKNSVTLWMSSEGVLQPPFTAPTTEDELFIQMLTGHKTRKPLHIVEMGGKQLKAHYRYMRTLPVVGEIFDSILEAGHPLPAYQVMHYAYFSKGFLLFITYEPVPGAHDIFTRFAGVFDQTYTRFLDLQKAEAQAREAQIEAALERVRSRTIGMQRSDELMDAAMLLFQQVEGLGVPVFGCGFNIWDEDQKEATAWMAGKDRFQPPFKTSSSADIFLRIHQAAQRGQQLFVEEQEGVALKQHYEYMNSIPVFREIAKSMAKGGQTFPTFQIMHCAFFSQGYLMFITFEPVLYAHDIFQRFTKVFEQTYTRFLDLQKAESQAREAHIEAALERVRAKATAMHHSDELMEVASVMREQFSLLGQSQLETVAIHIYPEEGDEFESWFAIRPPNEPGKVKTYTVQFSKTGTRLARQMMSLYQSKSAEYTLHAKGKEMQEWLEMINQKIPDLKKHWGTNMPREQFWYFSDFSSGSFLLIPREEPSQESRELLKRSASVFDLAYRRYKDLQKAESQAREAQIEAAMERVRARGMAMHKSEELLEAGEILCSEMSKLGIGCLTSGYVLIDKDTKIGWNYTPHPATGKIMPEAVGIPHNLTKELKKGLASWQKQESVCVIEMNEKETIAHQTFIADKSINFPISAKELIAISPKTLVLHNFNFREGYLLIVGGEKLNDKQTEIMLRFTRVFQQTYTRFLDLKKAEAQTREAEIELALERVRARTMAMQKSEELKEAASVLYKELRSLNIGDLVNSGYVFIDEKNNLQHAWMTHQDGTIRDAHTMPLTGDKIMNERYEKWKKGVHLVSQKLGGEELKKHHEFVLSQQKKVPENNKGLSQLPDPVIFYCGNFSKGYLHILSREELTEASESILYRFTKVFEQTYTRFLDLQKVEAQARESQIETALERIRARALAMHHSDELKDVAKVLREQMGSLGQPELETSAVHLYNEDPEYILSWRAFRLSTDLEGQITYGFFKMPKDSSAIAREFVQRFKSEESDYTIEVSGARQAEWYRFLFKLAPEVKEAMEKTGTTKEKRYYHLSKFSGGALLLVASKEPSREAKELQKRSAQVFDLAFRRYKDLQKAEAQAREAQVEAALERARTQSMIMQRSTELDDTLRVFHEQVLLLGIRSEFSFLWLPDEKNDQHLFWAAWTNDHSTRSKAVNYPLDRHEPATAQCFVDWKSGVPVHSYRIPPEGVEDYFSVWSELFAGTEKLQPSQFGQGLYYVEAFMKYGCFGVMVENELSEDEKKILLRLSIEFERAYTRFLDLLNAEAQAREAQIEAALERVRAKAMAMHKSDDFNSAVAVVFEEMEKLDLGMLRCGIGILSKERRVSDVWTIHRSETGNEIQVSGNEPMDIHALLKGDYDAWLRQEDFSYTLEGEDLVNYYRALSETDFKLPESQSILTVNKDTRQYYYVAPFEAGTLFAFREVEFPEEAKKVMKRFANVFNLTYKRFLDLQKAEAQAREARIEAALEKVRSRSIGMQKSDELKEVIRVVVDQLVILEIRVDHAGFVVDYTPRGDWHFWVADKQQIPAKISHPWFDSVWARQFDEAKEKGIEFFATCLSFEEKNKFYSDLLQYIPDLTEDARSFYFNCPGLAASNVLMDDVALYIENFSGIPYSDEENKILVRFGKVFQQTYTRFLDLQKAETQAREAQIQLALERVRARTMAMHKSDELPETSHILFEQMKELGEPVEQLTIGIIDEENNVVQISATLLGDTLKKTYSHGIEEPYMMNKIYKAWKKRQKTLVVELKGHELNAYNKYRNELTNSEMFPTNFEEEHRRIVYAAFFSRGMLALGANEPRPPESIQLLERFASVFDLTYTRFLDLQKAEAQAREAQIEAALEKVRSRTMAMQSSNELQETAALLFQEFKKLGSEEIYQVTIGIYNEAEQLIDFRVTNWDGSGKQEDRSFYLSMDEPTVLKPVVTAWKEKRKSVIIDLSGEALEGWLNYRNKMSGITVRSADTGGRRVISIAFYSKGHLSISSPLPVPDETLRILERFAVVFDSTYTRFLDLQKAEAQAREAQVEAALERVRAKAMAMHNSEDITATVDIFFKELKNLGITPIRCGVGQIDKDTRTSNVSATTSSKQGDSYEVIGKLKLEGHPVLDNIFNHWEKQEEYYPVLKGEELTQYYRTMNPQVGFPDYPGDAVQYGSYFYFKEGLVFTWTEEALSLEAIRIFRRFTSVIGLTYRRYMDLREAEAQAREAQVEAALERIRGQAMAMRESADLLDIVVTMRTEFLKLGHEAHYFWHMRWLPEKYHKAMTSGDGTRIGMIMELPRHMHGEIPLLSAWEKSEDPTVVYVMDTDEAIAYVDKMVSLGDFKLVDPNAPSHDDIRHIQGLTFVMARTRHGEIGYSLPGRVPEPPLEDISTLKRFADVFDLAYQRYEDLQKAEASTREAIKQAVLDRIRADIASMRTVEDLDRITPLIWNELTTLGVPFIRCGVFLMDDEHQQIHTFLSTPDGKAIAAFHLPYDTPGNFRNVINHWRSGNSYSDHWGEEEYIQFADILLKQGSISSTEQYLKTIPAGGFYLLFLPFQQGMLYVGNTSALDEDTIKLLQSVADAFSTAYARYEDFNKLEAAKKQVDATLVDLQQAQKQLIQSEKMASLGELTAGIAHEIQNPLNFVNNFSEVSNELIGEMLDEIEKGNFEVAREIAEDVRQNLGKIHFHGERAGGIVKGMLQHSRSSSGQKEPTDINALCDEYLRLAYHGLRAKDKTFNAHFETAFDPEIGRLAVQPQEIGRVVLNLINNAFYAVAERKKTAGEGYEPTVIVVTRRKEDKIEIEVKDNGGGIPGAVLEKIFQPFFTTKPTGQGTGLGLSLSYDIVKAHGGEIKVNTIENEGTEFIIQLPM